MEHQDIFLLAVAAAMVLAIVLSAIYYFARYYIRTDYDRDIERAKREAAVPPPPEAPPATPPATLRSALSNTRQTLFGRLQDVFNRSEKVAETREEIEEILYTSDLGPKTVQRLLEPIDSSMGTAEKMDLSTLKQVLQAEMSEILAKVTVPPLHWKQSGEKTNAPQVWMIVGVNGAGKTTTIGKIAHQAVQSGLKVLVAAGDTFRAAAQSQLKVWTERAQVEIFSPEGVTEPAAVAFDAVQMAMARKFDLVLIDTAGRLHTQKNLMEELKKVKRVIQKVMPEAPHEILIVLDANTGQNALVQATQFHEALHLTGSIVTKMDGTAKGGVILSLACELSLPAKMIGIGEGLNDLKTFDEKDYVDALLT